MFYHIRLSAKATQYLHNPVSWTPYQRKHHFSSIILRSSYVSISSDSFTSWSIIYRSSSISQQIYEELMQIVFGPLLYFTSSFIQFRLVFFLSFSLKNSLIPTATNSLSLCKPFLRYCKTCILLFVLQFFIASTPSFKFSPLISPTSFSYLWLYTKYVLVNSCPWIICYFSPHIHAHKYTCTQTIHTST